MKNVLSLCAFALFAGCTATGVYVDESSLRQFKNGQTTVNDVVNTLGQPTGRTVNSDGSASLQYQYHESTMRPEQVIPIVGVFAGGNDYRSSLVVLTFDKNQRLTGYTVDGIQLGTGTNLATGVFPARVPSTSRQNGQSVVGIDE